MKILALVIITLIAFAANSIFGRLALVSDAIDPVSYSAIRLFSAAVFLLVFVCAQGQFASVSRFKSYHPLASIALFVYALFFSLAYLILDAGTGALVMVAAVQITMICWSWFKGERLNGLQISGLFLACAGFVYLVYPDISTPSFSGFLLMVISGIAWGVYSLLGKQSKQPIIDTAKNFIGTLPLLLGVLIYILLNEDAYLSPYGFLLAAVSGAITSGAGYIIWYKTLEYLTGMQAAVVQLALPVMVGLGGVVFINEPMTLRFIIASVIILSGILLVIYRKSR